MAVFLQQDIDQIVLEQADAQGTIDRHTVFIVIPQMVGLLLLNVTCDIFGNVADINRTVYPVL